MEEEAGQENMIQRQMLQQQQQHLIETQLKMDPQVK